MWHHLKPGAGIAVVAPAGPAPRDPYDAGLKILAARYRFVRVYRPEVSTPAEGGFFPYLSAADVTRRGALNAAIHDPDVEAIFCARGGYGATRLLLRGGGEAIDWEALRAREIPLVGFSDITALHQAAARRGVMTVHGPVVTQLATLPRGDVEALFALLEAGAFPRIEGLSTLTPGRARGVLRGGNLAILAALCGTPDAPRFGGAVVFLEDIGESPYRLDRLLTQLLAAGAFEGAVGIVLGDWIACDADQGVPPSRVEVREVLVERLSSLGVPLVAGAPVGHGTRNLALPLGAAVELDAKAGTLRSVG